MSPIPTTARNLVFSQEFPYTEGSIFFHHTMLQLGEKAPDFTLATHNGNHISLSDYVGKQHVVLYFYPKDNTPGCTQEACDFRDNMARLQSSDTVVLGISKDSLASHQKFAEKYALPFELLSDPDHAVHDAYGAWQEKKFMGRTYMGTDRSTFLIDKQGILRGIWRNVKVKGHVDHVIDAIAELA